MSSSTYLDQDTVLESPLRWKSLPPTPSLPPSSGGSYVESNGIKVWYEVFGVDNTDHVPVVFLHGVFANSDWFGHQVSALRHSYKIVVIDNRGHGRSEFDAQTSLSSDLLSKDVLAVLDHLRIDKVAFVGWSNGAINALNIARKYPERVEKVFAFAASYHFGVKDGAFTQDVMLISAKRSYAESVRLTPHKDADPAWYQAFYTQVVTLLAAEPITTKDDYANINGSKIWFVAADHDEVLELDQTTTLASWVDGSGLVILPQVSHMAIIQDPDTFTAVVKRFLEVV